MAKTYEALVKAAKERQDGLRDFGEHPRTVRPLGETADGRTEEYYRLRLNLLRMSPGERIKTLLFSSPTGGEGASTVLASFAVAISGQGERVMLVDADFRSPTLHHRFQLRKENGLAELILGKSTLSEVIKKTTYENLLFISSGDVPTNPLPLGAFDAHIQAMKAEADWVLFDAPPVNHFDEGLALSGKVDGVVMILQAEKTRWEVAQNAKQRLEESGARILGAVLNKRRFYIPSWLYQTL